MKRLLLMGLLSVLVMDIVAFPKGCNPLSGIKNTITFNAKGQALYFIHNKGMFPIYLAFTNTTGTAHAGWTTKLDSQQWSALTLEDRSLPFRCIEEKPGSEQRVSCERVVEACLYVKVIFNKKNKGSYWVADNDTLEMIDEKVRAQGIQFKP